MDYDIELPLQIWKELRQYILDIDRGEAAETFVHTMMEHGVDPNDMMEFAVDSELKLILRDHADEEHFEDEDFDEDDDGEEAVDLGWGD